MKLGIKSMDPSAVSNKQGMTNTSPAPSTRNRSDQDYARQAAADDAVRQQGRAARNRVAERRLTQSAFEQSIEQDRALQKSNQQAGVEKMVRSVVRKDSARIAQPRPREDSQSADSDANADYIREKLNSTYGNTVSESPRDETLRPSPSQRQQQRAMENYQQSTRTSVDHTVELIV